MNDETIELLIKNAEIYLYPIAIIAIYETSDPSQ